MHHKLPSQLLNEIDKYFNLNIGGKKVRCPYFINNKISRGNLGVLSGKGNPQEIEYEVKVWAKLDKFDLNKATEDEIRKYMISKNIGIDCSGFISNVINTYLKQQNKSNLIYQLKFDDNSIIAKLRRFFRPIENIGARTLTSEENCEIIKNINNIKPGDLIRAKGKQRNADHVAMIIETERDDKNNLKSFKYTHSHRYYGDNNGVKIGDVIITDIKNELKDQDWKEIHSDGKNYMYEDLIINYEDNGIRRLKVMKCDS